MKNIFGPALKRLVLFWLLILMAGSVLAAARKGIDTTIITKETVLSRFYFPGSIGSSLPESNSRTQIDDGFSFNTAAEYRPKYMNSVFVRFNYDVLNNTYTTSLPRNVPTNVLTGKLTTSYFVMGLGYRYNLGNFAVYGALQGGMGNHSYERAMISPDGVAINYVTNKNFALKSSAGLEYYIARHFALVFEPAYYKILSATGFSSNHSRFVTFNIGITTTIF